MREAHSDVLIIGGGHNGLVCAAYLAGAGLKVRVLERRGIVGGAAVTEEFHPGFRNSTASYTVSLLNPKVIADLRLAEHGLRVVERPYANFLPLPDGRSFRLGGEHTQAEVAKWSVRDAQRLPAYYAMLERVVVVLRELMTRTPPIVSDGFVLADWLASYEVAKALKHLDMRGRRDLLDLFTKSAGELLDSYFESEPVKAVLGWDSVVGNFASPYTPGGVRLADGRELRAGTIVSNLNPKLLYQRLLPRDALDPDTSERIDRYRCGSGTFRMNVALSELPDFTAAPGTQLQPHHQSGILVGPSLRYFEQAYFDAKSKQYNPGWSRAPIVELVISSTLDDTLAPPGQHVASLFCQHVHPDVDGGWDAHRDTVANLMIDTVDAYAPNFRRSVLGYKALSPLDLEREFGLVGGDIFHGSLGLDQLFSARPLLGQGNYRGALPGLYLCGSGTHPGGGVTGLPGRNAAREILKDLRRGPRPQ